MTTETAVPAPSTIGGSPAVIRSVGKCFLLLLVSFGIWGFAFKKDTNDTRESAAITVCKDLLAEQARLAIYDPKVPADAIFRDLGIPATLADGKPNPAVTICADAYSATEGAHAAAVLTEWDEFKTIDFARVFSRMMKPASIFDGRNILDLAKLRALGFKASGIGKG